MKLYTKTITHDGYTVHIHVHHDEDMGEPWKEHDGHGIVSEWIVRGKSPGELVLCSDRNSRRYYDYKATLEIAKKDGWGLCEKSKAALAAKLGRKPTAKEIRHASVMEDYEHLRAWCNDEWSWTGYTTTIETPDGATIEGDSCWGFDGEDYMIEEATSAAKHTIETHKTTLRETAIAECVP